MKCLFPFNIFKLNLTTDSWKQIKHILFVCLTLGLFYYAALAVLELAHEAGWPQIHRNPPSSACQVLGSMAWTTTPLAFVTNTLCLISTLLTLAQSQQCSSWSYLLSLSEQTSFGNRICLLLHWDSPSTQWVSLQVCALDWIKGTSNPVPQDIAHWGYSHACPQENICVPWEGKWTKSRTTVGRLLWPSKT